MTSRTFQGFSRDTVAFFNELAENNERSWFEANRARYQLEVVQPAQAFVLGMTEPLRKVYPELQADPKRGAKLLRAVETIEAAGPYTLGGHHYKRIPRGYEVPQERAELICFNTIYTMLETPIPPEFYTSRLVDYCIEHFAVMRPLLQWLVEEMNI